MHSSSNSMLGSRAKSRGFRKAAAMRVEFRWMLLVGLALWVATVVCGGGAFSFAAAANQDGSNEQTLSIALSDGNSMPRVGLGVALIGDQTYRAVQHAIREGYSLFDTAAEESYGNEDQVGMAVSEYYHTADAQRKLFVTTKLWDTDHGFYQTLRAFFRSYQRIHENASSPPHLPMDLYLVHSPYGGRLLETWDALVWLQQQGLVTSIGVSNFGIEHLEVLRQNNRPLPVVNQIEMHPLVYGQRRDLLEYCREHSIVVQAFGSLMHGYPHLLEEQDFLSKMAQDYNMKKDGGGIKVTHILLQWAIQHGFAIIPKSSKTQRITENVKFMNLKGGKTLATDFWLTPEDMEVLDQWGDHLPYHHRNIYKRDWNWNPIDEAPLHIGREDYWPNYEGIPKLKNIESLERLLKDLPDDVVDEEEYWDEYWENGIPLEDDDDDDEYHHEEYDEDEEEFHQEL